MKKGEEEKPSPAPNYYQVTHLQASAVRKLTQSITKPRPLECNVCGSFWPSNSELTKHIRVHTGEKPFSCSYCNRCFNQKSLQNIHEKTHQNERPHKCPNCPKSYVQAGHLREHVMRKHVHLKLFDCPECPEKFYSSSNLKYHHMRNHGGELPFPCSLCGKKFLGRGKLNQHLHRVHGIMPYSCSKCSKKFRLQRELLCHEGTHQDDDDPETVKKSTTKQRIKSTVGQPARIPAKSLKNDNKVKTLVPGAKVQGSQQKENSGKKLIKLNKLSKAAVLKKSEIESEDEISVLCEVKKQTDNLVESEKVEKSRKKKKLKKVELKNDSMRVSEPTSKKLRLELEPPANDQKEKSSSKKKYRCSCGNSYKSIEKFSRHKVRNGHKDEKVITQQSSPLTKVDESPKKKSKLEKVKVSNEVRANVKVSSSASADYQNGEEDASILYQVQKETVNSEDGQLGKSSKKRKRMQIKTEPEIFSRIEEPSPKNKIEILPTNVNDDDEPEMYEKSSMKKYHCHCGKSYKSSEKFQRHQQRNGHDNEEKVNVSIQLQSATSNQENKEYHQVDAKGLEKENGKKSKKKKKVQQFKVDEKDNNNCKKELKCERKEIKKEELEKKVRIEMTDLKIKTEVTSFDDHGSQKKRSKKKIKYEKVYLNVEYKEKENKVKPVKYEVQKKDMKTEKVNKDEKSIPDNELKGEKPLKAKKKIKTELPPTTNSQPSTINRVEIKEKRREQQDIIDIGESQEDEIEILGIKLANAHQGDSVEKCSCGKLFSTPEKLQRHRERKGHHIPKTYKCFCSTQVFNTLQEFRGHLWASHSS